MTDDPTAQQQMPNAGNAQWHYDKGAKAERARIVAWLRATEPDPEWASDSYAHAIANAIERGDHADCPIPAAGEVAKPCSACATTMCDPCHECGGSGYESAVNT